MENYTIYKFTFSDGKVYIGQTSEPVEQRWKNGEGYKGQDVYVPIALEGWNNIKKEILHTGLTAEQANQLEKHYIKKFNSITNGYNRSTGGHNNKKKYINININLSLSDFFNHLPIYSKELNGNAFKMLIYFYLHNHTNFYLNYTDIFQSMGIPSQSCSDSFKELINKGYLIKQEENYYLLHLE